MILAHHVYEVVFAKELFAKRVAHEVKSIGAHIGEDLVGELRVTDEENESADDVVGGEASWG